MTTRSDNPIPLTLPKPSSYRERWEAIEAQFDTMTEKGEAQEQRVAILCDQFDEVTREVWKLTARDLDDILFLAESAYHYLGIAEGVFPMLPADMEQRSVDEVAVASLLRGVAAVTEPGVGLRAIDTTDDRITRAAAAVHQLIQRSPRSPSEAEIAGVLVAALREGVVSPEADDPLAQEWERARAALEADCDDPARAADDCSAELLERVSEATLAIWRRGARSAADLGLFAQMARYWYWPLLTADAKEDDDGFKEGLVLSPLGLDDQSVAQLVNATLQVLGRQAGAVTAADDPTPPARPARHSVDGS
jgi:hypothetical protein